MNGFKNDSNNCCSAHTNFENAKRDLKTTAHKQRNSKDSNDSESSKKSKNQKFIKQKEQDGVTPTGDQKIATDEQNQNAMMNPENDDFTMQAFIGALRKLQQVKEYPQIHNIIDNIIKNINSGNMGGTGKQDINQTLGQNAVTQNTNISSGQTNNNYPSLQ